MSSEITIFTFKERPVRVVEDGGTPWWVVGDVCRALEIRNSRDALAGLDEDDVATTDIIDALGRSQKANIVSESGLYALILGSRKPEARAFKRWVTHEVLPTIRATGSFNHNGSAANSLNGFEEKRIEKMIRHLERIIGDRRAGRIDNSTASTLSALACQYCRLWDIRLRVRGTQLALPPPKL